ncbi:homeobox KN domain-containing protein [Ditylenchus destructor]|nr:homeobox KN domain-containing protein [Ditylenchus destructor]
MWGTTQAHHQLQVSALLESVGAVRRPDVVTIPQYHTTVCWSVDFQACPQPSLYYDYHHCQWREYWKPPGWRLHFVVCTHVSQLLLAHDSTVAKYNYSHMVSSPLMSALVERQNTAASEVGPCMMRGLNANSDVLIQLATNKKQEEGRKELAINGTGDNTDENVHGTNANRKETSKAPNNMLSEKEAAEHIAEIVGKVIASQRQANGNECDKVNTTVQDVENHSDTGTSASDGNDGVVPNTLAEKQKREFQEWMSRHGNNLYPSRQDKEQLADQLGISYLQVTRLLANFRRRHLKYKRCAQLAQAKNEQNMDSFEHEQPSVRNAETTQVDNSVLQGEPTILNFHEEHEDNDYPPTKVPRMDIAEESSGKADELERQRRIDETIHSIFSRVFNSEGHIEEEHRERILEPASNEGDAVAAILQLQAHGTSHKGGDFLIC